MPSDAKFVEDCELASWLWFISSGNVAAAALAAADWMSLGWVEAGRGRNGAR